jgi:enoyl-CoA hydratase/carnithine racemase
MSSAVAIRQRRPAPPKPRQGRVPPGIRLRRDGAGTVLHLNTPHPGAWTDAFRAEAIRLLLACRADSQRIVLTGPKLFIGRAESETPPDIADLLAAIAAPGTPVIAAIPGLATGIGLELALACQARVATPVARFALPEIGRARLPVNGAAERLPRLVGLAAAAEMIAFGKTLTAEAALRARLVDACAEDIVGIALSMPIPTRTTPPSAGMATLRAAVRRRAPSQAAPLAALQALDHAARLPPPRAAAETRRLAAGLAASEQASALRHAATLRHYAIAPEAADRLRWALLRSAIHLLDAGATPMAVDRALLGFGFSHAPFVTADRLGLPEVVSAWVDPHPTPWHLYSPTLDLLLDAGRLGRQAGRGWYCYAHPAAQPQHDPELDRLLQDSARARQQRRAAIAPADILGECLAGLLDTATRLALPDTDAIDALSLSAVGFPRWRGGLWHHATRQSETITPHRISNTW